MRTLDDVLRLRGADLAAAAAALGADRGRREKTSGYEGLSKLDAIDAPDGSQLLARGDALALVYIGTESMPTGVRSDDLVSALGSSGRSLRSRQGKSARMHVLAEEGIAWSEEDGDIGFIEIFPARSFDEYTRDIYEEPPKFVK